MGGKRADSNANIAILGLHYLNAIHACPFFLVIEMIFLNHHLTRDATLEWFGIHYPQYVTLKGKPRLPKTDAEWKALDIKQMDDLAEYMALAGNVAPSKIDELRRAYDVFLDKMIKLDPLCNEK